MAIQSVTFEGASQTDALNQLLDWVWQEFWDNDGDISIVNANFEGDDQNVVLTVEYEDYEDEEEDEEEFEEEYVEEPEATEVKQSGADSQIYQPSRLGLAEWVLILALVTALVIMAVSFFSNQG